MGNKLYVGNLSYKTSEENLSSYFSSYGTVTSTKIIFDRDSGKSKGFGFVEMSSEEEANAAVQDTNGKEFDGRQIRVNLAMDKPRRDRSSGGGYGEY
ncbi:MAG: RNA-binding protein [Spirochaetaceae bacterium]|jgi:RNA recognition motif-containing protein|nr:RNA-binding protein [Spirochaetaceae bacterium]